MYTAASFGFVCGSFFTPIYPLLFCSPMLEHEKCKVRSSPESSATKKPGKSHCTEFKGAGSQTDTACTRSLFQTETVSPSPRRTDRTYSAATCACLSSVAPRGFWEVLVWSSLTLSQGSHQVIPTTTKPAVQCTKLDPRPNKGIGITAWVSLHSLCNTQAVPTTVSLRASLVLRYAVRCEADPNLTFFDEPEPLIFRLSCSTITKWMFLPFLVAEITLEHPPGHRKPHMKCWDLAGTVG